MPPTVTPLHRCPNSEVPRPVDKHDPTPGIAPHTVSTLRYRQMPQCRDCGADYVFTLAGALGFAIEWKMLERTDWLAEAEMAVLRDSIFLLERYTIQRWGQGINLQTSEDLDRELCRLRDDLRQSIPGLGTYYDLDAAYALPLSEAVRTLGDVRPFEGSVATTGNADRYFMEIAIHEARQSVGEEGRHDPRVGAVVVRAGIVLATAHRGEKAPGDHAEYTALEKKLKNESLAGATVYTTLEPCTRRSLSKTPCVQRLIDRGVARVLIGMLDPNPAICGRGERLLRDKTIEVERFPHDLIIRLEELNRDFTRAHSSPQ
jgi:pyrimidine deaminase RibD-like protein